MNSLSHCGSRGPDNSRHPGVLPCGSRTCQCLQRRCPRREAYIGLAVAISRGRPGRPWMCGVPWCQRTGGARQAASGLSEPAIARPGPEQARTSSSARSGAGRRAGAAARARRAAGLRVPGRHRRRRRSLRRRALRGRGRRRRVNLARARARACTRVNVARAGSVRGSHYSSMLGRVSPRARPARGTS